jgi:hypothetical protein
MKPVRIQRRRAKGYDMQAVSRALNGLPSISARGQGAGAIPRMFGYSGASHR